MGKGWVILNSCASLHPTVSGVVLQNGTEMFAREGTLFFSSPFQSLLFILLPPPHSKEANKPTKYPVKTSQEQTTTAANFFSNPALSPYNLFPPLPPLPSPLPAVYGTPTYDTCPPTCLSSPHHTAASHHITSPHVPYCTVLCVTFPVHYTYLPSFLHQSVRPSIQFIIPYHHIPPSLSPFLQPHLVRIVVFGHPCPNPQPSPTPLDQGVAGWDRNTGR